MGKSGQIEPEELKRFIPFQGLDDHQLLLLSNNLVYRHVPAGHRLFESGDIDSNEFFLLKGTLRLESVDGGSREVSDTDEVAKRQIARLRPRQYTVTMVGEGDFFIVDADILEELQLELGVKDTTENYSVDEFSSVEELESRELFTKFQSALRQNTLILPSLPEVALKVRKMLENDDSNAEAIAHVINSDPAIAAKIIRAGNSPLYHGTTTCGSARNAIVRLGLQTTKQLVVSFALRDLFRTLSPNLKKRMQAAWEHSVEVAAISFVIARLVKSQKYPAEDVMLAGLLHNIGVIAILAFVETLSPGTKASASKASATKAPETAPEAKVPESKPPEESEDNVKIDLLLHQCCGKAGEEILKQWKFSEAFTKVALEAENWQRDHSSAVDMCDIVQVAKLHSYMRNKQPMPVPRMDQVPAFHKLPLGSLTPELTIQILEQSKDLISEARQLLNA